MDTVSASPTTSVADARSRIDALDEEIIALIAKRIQLGQEVVRHKTEAGLTRIDHAREQQILHTYLDALGPEGAQIILRILSMTRGLS